MGGEGVHCGDIDSVLAFDRVDYNPLRSASGIVSLNTGNVSARFLYSFHFVRNLEELSLNTINSYDAFETFACLNGNTIPNLCCLSNIKG